MRRILVCTGVLGGGTALVFALAAATAMIFPQGTMVSSGWNGNVILNVKAMPMRLDDTLTITDVDGGPVIAPGVNIEPPPDPEPES